MKSPFNRSLINAARTAFTGILFLAAGLAHAAPGDTVPVRVQVPEIGSVKWTERATGELIAPRRAVLKMKVNGRFDTVTVREGDRVTRGQVLATLDLADAYLMLDQATSTSKAIDAQVAAARAGLEAAKTGKKLAEIRLDTATRDYERAKSLRSKDTIPQQQFDQIEGQYNLARMGIEAAEKQIVQAQAGLEAVQSQFQASAVGIRSARQRLADSALVAPFDGLVVSKSMMDHEQSQDQTITLVDDSELELSTRLPERLLPFVSVGTRLSLRSPVVADPIETTVSIVIPAVDPQTLTFLIKARIKNGDHRLNHGGYADVGILIREDGQVPIVPSEAVRVTKAVQAGNTSTETVRDAGAEHPSAGFVFTVKDGKARKIPVTMGLSRNSMVAIVSGLASGTPIVVAGQDQLDEGTPVIESTGAGR